MTVQLKKIVAYVLSIALGAFLLYLALQDVSTTELKNALTTASYGWILPVVVLILLSHALRAWRWQILLEALPDRQRRGELNSISYKTAFMSLLLGYFVNLLVPRMGEVARAGSLSKQEKVSFSGVFGTVVSERVFDVAVLLLGIASLSVLFYEQFIFLKDAVLTPLTGLSEQFSIGWTMISLTGIGAVAYLAVRSLKSGQSSRLMKIRRRLVSILNSFKDGMMTLLRAPRRGALLVSTVLMWSCYVLMALLTFVMLDMHTDYNLGLGAAWSMMIFGSIGFAVPAPGGTGSFHYFARIALVNLYFVDEATAIAYAILSHGLHVIVYVITGIMALFIQGSNLKSLREQTLDSEL